MKAELHQLLKRINRYRYRYRNKKARLGVTYSVFNGEELLRGSILTIREHVDYVNVVYQEYSWFGQPAAPGLLDTLEKLKHEKLIDKIIKFEFHDFVQSRPLKEYVIKKKNVGLDDLKKNLCTHCMIMDADEFYKSDEFATAKEFVIGFGITHSCCSIYDYRFMPTCRNRDVNKYAVPFIFKLRRNSKITGRHHMPCFIDDLRSLGYLRYIDRFYYLNGVCMHHMTGLRRNYYDKLSASVSNASEKGKIHIQRTREKYMNEIEMSEQELYQTTNECGGYIKVQDYFGIEGDFDLKNGENDGGKT